MEKLVKELQEVLLKHNANILGTGELTTITLQIVLEDNKTSEKEFVYISGQSTCTQ